jgi:hypothetical protein
VADAQLGKQGVDCANLHARATTLIAQLGRVNVVFSIWTKKRQRTETLDDVFAGSRPGKPLQKFLQLE